jgi:hypothetical protein
MIENKGKHFHNITYYKYDGMSELYANSLSDRSCKCRGKDSGKSYGDNSGGSYIIQAKVRQRASTAASSSKVIMILIPKQILLIFWL